MTIINDPIYGFIRIPSALHFAVIEHPFFQRLRRIKQLGLTHLVYPGALHTRFHHSLGSMYLMQQALRVLRSKGHIVTAEDESAATLAILLHDIGHGPYSHTLEKNIVTSLDHEKLTYMFLIHLNKQFDGQLEDVLQIFDNTYPRKYLSKLVSSQLDMDRLDYLRRDSFFTGVAEGSINSERLISMLDIRQDEPVIDAKGIYSVEHFLVARRLMYWQVYLHKTVLAAEYMLRKVLQRARYLLHNGDELAASAALYYFLKNDPAEDEFREDEELLKRFAALDDFDIFMALKQWQSHPDTILSFLSQSLVNRRLFRVELSVNPFDNAYVEQVKEKIAKKFLVEEPELNFLFIHEITSNSAYSRTHEAIRIVYADGRLCDATEASDQLNISALAHPVTKYFVCYPKGLEK